MFTLVTLTTWFHSSLSRGSFFFLTQVRLLTEKKNGAAKSFMCVYSFIYGCAGSSLLCQLLSSYGERGLLFIAVHRLPIAVVSLVVKHGL